MSKLCTAAPVDNLKTPSLRGVWRSATW